MGHIAICDGRGGTVEAKGRAYGVVRDEVHGRPWDTGVLIPGIEYDPGVVPITPPTHVYAVGARGMNRDVVKRIQEALARVKTGSNPDRYLNPGPIDGLYGPRTAAAVYAFQEIAGLITDGQVGPQTAAALGISLGQPTLTETSRGSGPVTHTPFSIDPNLKTTMSPLTAEKIRSFFAHQTESRDALKDIGEAVMEASAKYGIKTPHT